MNVKVYVREDYLDLDVVNTWLWENPDGGNNLRFRYGTESLSANYVVDKIKLKLSPARWNVDMSRYQKVDIKFTNEMYNELKMNGKILIKNQGKEEIYHLDAENVYYDQGEKHTGLFLKLSGSHPKGTISSEQVNELNREIERLVDTLIKQVSTPLHEQITDLKKSLRTARWQVLFLTAVIIIMTVFSAVR